MVTFIFFFAVILGILTFVGGVALCVKYIKEKKMGLAIILLIMFTIIASALMFLAVSVGYLSQM